jgi:pimeloyl-ACP methyl ester carboxylesterase
MRLLLYEDGEAARRNATQLSPQGQALMAQLFDHDHSRITPRLLENIEKSQTRLEKLSPRRNLGTLHAPVLLVHGSGDDIIPPSESLWLAQEVPTPYMKKVLITPLLSHVDFQKVSVGEKLAVVQFMAELLDISRERT